MSLFTAKTRQVEYGWKVEREGREEQANSGKVIQAYSPIGSYLHTKKRHS